MKDLWNRLCVLNCHSNSFKCTFFGMNKRDGISDNFSRIGVYDRREIQVNTVVDDVSKITECLKNPPTMKESCGGLYGNWTSINQEAIAYLICFLQSSCKLTSDNRLQSELVVAVDNIIIFLQRFCLWLSCIFSHNRTSFMLIALSEKQVFLGSISGIYSHFELFIRSLKLTVFELGFTVFCILVSVLQDVASNNNPVIVNMRLRKTIILVIWLNKR